MNPNDRAVDSYGRCRINDNRCHTSRPWDAYNTPSTAATAESTSTTSTTTDRRLLAEVSRWRKANGWTDSSRGWIDADTLDGARVAIKADPDATDVFHVTWRKGNGGWHQPRQYDAVDLQQAIDLLVALCILPDRFATAYRSGWLAGVLAAGSTPASVR